MEIKCPNCGYDGSDLSIGRKPISIDVVGVSRIICSKCKYEFVVKMEFELDYCKICNQMTNHLNKKCCKCQLRGTNIRKCV